MMTLPGLETTLAVDAALATRDSPPEPPRGRCPFLRRCPCEGSWRACYVVNALLVAPVAWLVLAAWGPVLRGSW